jgi:hypothetical protein
MVKILARQYTDQVNSRFRLSTIPARERLPSCFPSQFSYGTLKQAARFSLQILTSWRVLIISSSHLMTQNIDS